jgi:hypothetical protein
VLRSALHEKGMIMLSLALHVIIMSDTFSVGNYQTCYRHILNSPLAPSLGGYTRHIPKVSFKTQIVLCLPCVTYSRTAEKRSSRKPVFIWAA